MLKKVQQWLEPPYFEGDEEQTNQARIANTLILYLGAALLIVIFILIPLFAFQKIGSWMISTIILCGLVIGRYYIFKGNFQLGTALVFAIIYLCILAMLIFSGGESSTAMFYFATTILIAGFFLNAWLVNGLTLTTFLLGMGLSFLQNRGWTTIPKVFVFNSVFSWIATGIGLLFMIRARDLFVGNLRTAVRTAQEKNVALQNSESRLKALIQNGLDYISLLDAGGNLLWESPSSTKMLGYRFNEFLGKNIFEVMHPDDLEWVSREFSEVATKPGTSRSGVFRLGRTDGSWRWVEAIVSNALHDPAVGAIIVNYRDITERKQAEEKLREGEEKFHTAFMVSSDSININRLDDGTYISVNRGFTQLMGYSESDVIGKTSLEIHIWDDPADRQKMVAGLKEYGFVNNLESRFVRKDGCITYGLMSASVIDLGGIPHIFSITRDITERKQTEAALRDSEEKFRRLFETSKDFLYITTMDGGIAEVNKAASEMSGYSVDELKKINIGEIYLDPSERALLVREITQRGFVENLEVKGKRKDGTILDALVTSTVIKDDTGNVIGFQGSIKNITERKQSEAKIRAALEEKEVLLREIHHRVKNNLQVIIALIKMRNNSTQDEETRQFLKELEGQARTMSLVYEQLYQAENLSQIDMDAYLRQLTSNVLDSFGARNAIQVNVEAPLMLDVAKAMPCGLIVNELLSNILKHAFPFGCQAAPAVIISMRQEGEICRLIVGDNGVGLPSGFDWRSGQSMGLRLVELWATHQLGGNIRVASDTGATFTIDFELKG